MRAELAALVTLVTFIRGGNLCDSHHCMIWTSGRSVSTLRITGSRISRMKSGAKHACLGPIHEPLHHSYFQEVLDNCVQTSSLDFGGLEVDAGLVQVLLFLGHLRLETLLNLQSHRHELFQSVDALQGKYLLPPLLQINCKVMSGV